MLSRLPASDSVPQCHAPHILPWLLPGDRLKEATKINLSLSALGNVISALVDSKSGAWSSLASLAAQLLELCNRKPQPAWTAGFCAWCSIKSSERQGWLH